MLSRCKRGMVLVTQRAFIDNGGKRTLLGKLVRRWQILEGADGVWVDAMAVAGGRAHLPGAPGKPQAAQLAENAEALTASVAALSLTLAAGARAISG